MGFLLATAVSIPAAPGGREESGSVPPPRVSRETRSLSEDYTVRVFGAAEGVPSERITCLVRTRDGYLWVGTAGGLVRFDGVRFVRFDHARVDALEDHRILHVVEDGRGALWIATEDGRLRIFGVGGWSDPILAGQEGSFCERVHPAGDGGVWIKERARWMRSGPAEDFPGAGGEPRRVPGPRESRDAVEYLEAGPEGRGWIDFDGLHLEEAGASEPRHYPLPAGPDRSFAAATSVRASNGVRWFLWGMYARSEPFHLYRLEGRTLDLIDDRLPPPPRLPMCLAIDREGAAWHGLDLGAVGRTIPGSGVRYRLDAGRPDDVAVAAVADPDGGVWFALERGRLMHLLPRRMRAAGAASGLPHPMARAVMPGDRDSLWVGTDDGVARVVAGPGGWTAVEVGLKGMSVRALATDAQGRRFAGTSRGLFQQRGQAWEEVPLPRRVTSSDGDAFGSLKVRELLPLREGGLWVAAPHQLSALPADGGEVRVLARAPNLGLSDLLEDRAGNLWLATDRAGVVVLDAAEGRLAYGRDLEEVPAFPEDRWCLRPAGWLREGRGLPSDQAWELLEDPEGTLWIAGPRGVVRLPAAGVRAVAAGTSWPLEPSGTPFVFTSWHGLPELEFNCLAADGEGFLWLGGDRGIYRGPRATFARVAGGLGETVALEGFSFLDGLPAEETNGRVSHPGAAVDPEGRVWFGTTNGVVCFPPQTSANAAARPKVAIEEVRLDGDIVTTTFPREPEGGALGGKTREAGRRPGARIPPTARIVGESRLGPGRGRVLEIQFTGLLDSAPRELRFRAQLEGYDAEPRDLGDRRIVHYTNLDPGAYRFRVWAVNRTGMASESPAEWRLILVPHPWQTGWFKALVVLAAGGATLGAIRVRTRRIHRLEALRRRAEQAELRARLARDLHDGVGSGLARLAILSHLPADGNLPPAEVAPKLRELSGAVRELAETVREISWSANPSPISLESLVAQIAQQAAEFLGAAGIRCRTSLPLEFPECQLSPEQRSDLYFSAKELCTNTVRHSGATEARLDVTLRDGTLELSFFDNGRGLPDGEATGMDPVSPDAGTPGRGGHGLPNLRTRVARLGGRLSVESPPGRGLTVWIGIGLEGLGCRRTRDED